MVTSSDMNDSAGVIGGTGQVLSPGSTPGLLNIIIHIHSLHVSPHKFGAFFSMNPSNDTLKIGTNCFGCVGRFNPFLPFSNQPKRVID